MQSSLLASAPVFFKDRTPEHTEKITNKNYQLFSRDHRDSFYPWNQIRHLEAWNKRSQLFHICKVSGLFLPSWHIWAFREEVLVVCVFLYSAWLFWSAVLSAGSWNTGNSFPNQVRMLFLVVNPAHELVCIFPPSLDNSTIIVMDFQQSDILFKHEKRVSSP